jgi:hypothetical protein
MKSAPLKSIICLLTCIIFLSACVGGGNVNSNNSSDNSVQSKNDNNNANIAKDDVVELANLINSPFEFDESSVWREVKVNESSGNKKLIAVLKFKPEDAVEIVKRADGYKPSVPAELEAESWFPPELVAQSGNSGDEMLKGNSYAANDFVKTPYIGGKLTRIANTDYFVLELTTF